MLINSAGYERHSGCLCLEKENLYPHWSPSKLVTYSVKHFVFSVVEDKVVLVFLAKCRFLKASANKNAILVFAI